MLGHIEMNNRWRSSIQFIFNCALISKCRLFLIWCSGCLSALWKCSHLIAFLSVSFRFSRYSFPLPFYSCSFVLSENTCGSVKCRTEHCEAATDNKLCDIWQEIADFGLFTAHKSLQLYTIQLSWFSEVTHCYSTPLITQAKRINRRP